MKLQFLGTGAADWPNPGKDVGHSRRYSSMILDGNVMIDCGPMTVDAIEEFGVEVNALSCVVISHPHSDHLNFKQVTEIARRRSKKLPPLELYLNKLFVELARVRLCGERVEVKGFQQTDHFHAGGCEFRSFPANHMSEMNAPVASHLVITNAEERTLFYQLDGSWLPPEVWKYLFREWHPKTDKALDAIIWELTCGNQVDWRQFEGHANFAMVREMTAVLREYGIVGTRTRMFCTHIAKFIEDDHESLQAAITPNYTLAYDGLTTEF
ncbi:MAG: MBL fold metallo-hydrolase [Victivallales bacterium]|nr:MBL fold metallo-hydrolase [Victivallales bacterium]